MAQPYNYMLNVPEPGQDILQGVKLGATLGGIQQQKQLNDLALQQQQAEFQRSQQASQAFSDLISNPNATAEDYAKVSSLLPKDQAESLRASWEMMDKPKQTSNLNFSGQVLAAFKSGSNDVGIKLLKERAEAEKASGNVDGARAYETWAGIAENNPKLAEATIGTMVSAIPGGDKVIESVSKLGAPGIESQKIDIEKQKLVMRNQENQLRAMEAAMARETNELKKQELQQKIDAKKTEIEQNKVEQQSGAENTISTLDRSIEQINKIAEHPGLKYATGFASIASAIPGTPMRDVSALVETLKSQAFMSEIQNMKGMGALSDAEGKKVSSAVANLDMGQSTEAFKENLNTALNTFKAAKQRAMDKFKKMGISTEPTEVKTQPSIEDLLTKYGAK